MFEVNGLIVHGIRDIAGATATLDRMPMVPNFISDLGNSSLGVLWLTKPHIYTLIWEETQNALYLTLRQARWNCRRIGYQLKPSGKPVRDNALCRIDPHNLHRAYAHIIYRGQDDPLNFFEKVLIDELRHLLDAGQWPQPRDVIQRAMADNADLFDGWSAQRAAAVLRRLGIRPYKSNGVCRYRQRTALTKLLALPNKRPAYIFKP